jgi:hypothetical protein
MWQTTCSSLVLAPAVFRLQKRTVRPCNPRALRTSIVASSTARVRVDVGKTTRREALSASLLAAVMAPALLLHTPAAAQAAPATGVSTVRYSPDPLVVAVHRGVDVPEAV